MLKNAAKLLKKKYEQMILMGLFTKFIQKESHLLLFIMKVIEINGAKTSD